jgi:hypothetical protein
VLSASTAAVTAVLLVVAAVVSVVASGNRNDGHEANSASNDPGSPSVTIGPRFFCPVHPVHAATTATYFVVCQQVRL